LATIQKLSRENLREREKKMGDKNPNHTGPRLRVFINGKKNPETEVKLISTQHIKKNTKNSE